MGTENKLYPLEEQHALLTTKHPLFHHFLMEYNIYLYNIVQMIASNMYIVHVYTYKKPLRRGGNSFKKKVTILSIAAIRPWYGRQLGMMAQHL